MNITEHVLVPEHILLNDDEKKTLLDRYKAGSRRLAGYTSPLHFLISSLSHRCVPRQLHVSTRRLSKEMCSSLYAQVELKRGD